MLMDSDERSYLLAHKMHTVLLQLLFRDQKDRKDRSTEWFHNITLNEVNFPDLARCVCVVFSFFKERCVCVCVCAVCCL